MSVALLAHLPTGPLAAQIPRPAAPPSNQTPLQRAFDLERRGSYAQAAVAYRGLLQTDPGDQVALLGLERTLANSDKVAEMTAEVRAGMAANPTAPVFGLALRVWAAANQPDSMRMVAERWASTEGDKTVPYREWGDLLLQRRDFLGARRAYTAGRTASGTANTLSAELALVAQLMSDPVTSAKEWLLAQALSPGYRAAAITSLAPTPERYRADVLRTLAPENGGDEGFLAAVLLAQWGDPLRGADALRRSVGSTVAAGRNGADLVSAFIEQVRTLGTRDARAALGQALELLADRQLPAQAARTRLEAARAYADGGDPPAARRMLALIAADRTAGGELSIQAARTLLDVQIAGGELEAAEQTFLAQGDLIPVEDRGILRRRLALAWIRRGSLDRADRLALSDSSVDGAALSGRLALLRGDLKGARTLLQAAGPYAGTRTESTERTALLALIQPIEADSLPKLGAALLSLERADTVVAIQELDEAVVGLPPAQGGAAIALLAAQLEWARGGVVAAERRFKSVAATNVPATAPAAEFDLARLLVSVGRRTEAVTQLEHLILTYPRSALIPQARRLRDELRAGSQAT